MIIKVKIIVLIKWSYNWFWRSQVNMAINLVRYYTPSIPELQIEVLRK